MMRWLVLIGFLGGCLGLGSIQSSRESQSYTSAHSVQSVVEIIDAPVVLEAVDPGLPIIHDVFEGLTPTGGASDSGIAVGDDTIVVTNNHLMESYTRQGEVRRTLNFTLFFPERLGKAPFDPQVVWDHINKRFIVVVMVGFTQTETGYIGIIASRNSNPSAESDWCTHRIFPLPSSTKIIVPDRDFISINPVSNLLFVSSNLYDPHGSTDKGDWTEVGHNLMKFRLTDIYTCQADIPRKEGNGTMLPDEPAVHAMSMVPVQWVGNFATNNAYFIKNYYDSGRGIRKTYLWRMENNFESIEPPIHEATFEGMTFDTAPPLPRIEGGIIENRTSPMILQALLHDGVLWATFDEKDDVNTRSTVSILRYDGTPLVIQRFGHSRESDYAFQSIMVDHKSRVGVLFNMTKTSEPTLSGGLAVSGLTGNVSSLQDGYRGPMPAVIDYSGATIDPDGVDLWFAGVYHDPNDSSKMKFIRVNFNPKVLLPLMMK